MNESLGFNLDGKVALVTGGGTGIGFGIAQAFVCAGAKVVIVGRREEVLKSAVEKIGAGVDYVVGDITQLDTLPSLVDDIVNKYGALHILVNNAGRNLKKPMEEVSDKEFGDVIFLNLNAQFSLTREVVKIMKTNGYGVIINISSMAAIYGIIKTVAYSSSKTGLLGMTRELATELGPLGIRVNAIAPGFIDSDMLQNAISGDPERRNKILSRTALGGFGSSHDIGAAAVYLASDAGQFVTGVTLPVDGGNSIGF